MSPRKVLPFLSNSTAGRFLSNFYKCTIVLFGLTFTQGSEQAYAYVKASLVVHPDDRRKFQQDILKVSSPREAKRLIGQINAKYKETKVMEKFEAVQELVMTKIVLAKFEQNPALRRQLLDTGNDLLVEANPNDFTWGCGEKENAVKHKFRNQPGWKPHGNLLGNILLDIREYLAYPDSPVRKSAVLVGDSILTEVDFWELKFVGPVQH
jgi:ribA/ribD-fused uncharacterized protein